MRRRYLILAGALLLLLLSCSEKYVLDWKMAQLCKKDGGMTIFETVKIPASRFGKYGELPYKGSAKGVDLFVTSLLEGEYEVVTKNVSLKNKGDSDSLYVRGGLDRTSEEVIRKSDNKVLGKIVWYSRTGGEINLTGMPSASSCPYPRGNLIAHVFLKENK